MIKDLGIAPLPLASANVKEAFKDGVRKIVIEASDFTANVNGGLECRLQLPLFSADTFMVTFKEDVFPLLDKQMLGLSIEAMEESEEAYGKADVILDMTNSTAVNNGINVQAGADYAVLGGKSVCFAITFDRFGNKLDSSGFIDKVPALPQTELQYTPFIGGV